jgi:hypothetical protein
MFSSEVYLYSLCFCFVKHVYLHTRSVPKALFPVFCAFVAARRVGWARSGRALSMEDRVIWLMCFYARLGTAMV